MAKREDIFPKEVLNLIAQFQKLPGVGPKSASRMAYHYLRAGNDHAEELATALQDMVRHTTECEKCHNVSSTPVCPICADDRRDRTKLCVVEEPLDIVAFEEAGIYDGIYFVLGGVISPADGKYAEELRFAELKERVRELLAILPDDANSSNATNPIQKKSPGNTSVHTNTDTKQATAEDADDNERIADTHTGKPDISDQISNTKLEVIIATNPSLEGEATATYIQKLLDTHQSDGSIKITRIAMGLPNGVDLEYADRLTLKRALEGRG